MKTEQFTIGDRIYYTGDMANSPGWFKVSGFMPGLGGQIKLTECTTGEIFGIKAYGVIHRGHRYGTLDTTGEFDWSGYTGVRKAKAA